MSLNWDLSNVRDHEELFVEREATPTQEGGKYLNGLTEALIWTSIATGLGKGWSLDEAFAPEFYARLKLIEKVNGPLTIGKDAKPVSWEDVQRHIGLHVNVSPVSRAAFLKNMVTADMDRAVATYKREAAKATVSPAAE